MVVFSNGKCVRMRKQMRTERWNDDVMQGRMDGGTPINVADGHKHTLGMGIILKRTEDQVTSLLWV